MATMGQAATLVIENGILMGATGVDVGGVEYDVSFVDGSCIALFGGCDATSDFTFQTYASAQLASQALLDQVFIETDTLNFDADPELTNGITNTSWAWVFTPFAYELMEDNVTSIVRPFAARNGSSSDSVIGEMMLYPDYDLSSVSDMTYAVWSLAATTPTAAVPLPAGAWLMTAAVGGLGLLRRLQTRA